MVYDDIEVIQRQTAPRRGPVRVSRLRLAGRLVLPVVGLFAVFILAYLTHDIAITAAEVPALALFDRLPAENYYLDPRWWPLTWGYVVLPLVFFVTHLTNRAYGADYALAGVAITWALLAGLVAAVLTGLEGALTTSPLPPRQTVLAFALGMAAGQIVGVFVFDRTRGTQWWTAPLWGSLFGAGVYTALFHGIGGLGDGEPWWGRMSLDFALHAAAAVILLLPYYMLRGMIRPPPYFGGA